MEDRILASNPRYSLMPIEKALEKIEEAFYGWEIVAEKKHGYEHKDEMIDVLSTTDMTLQLHAPLNDINIASINPTIRDASIEEVKRSLELASAVGVNVVTVHPGLYSPLAIYCDDILELSLDSLKRLKITAEDFGVKLAVENLPEMWLTLCSEPEEIKELLQNSDLGFCLDIGHAYTAGRLQDFLEFSIKPVNVHLHDNEGGDDIHLPLGDGEIDFQNILKNLKDYDGNFVIEGRGTEELRKSKKFLKRLINDLDI